jgi:hypothetical protein
MSQPSAQGIASLFRGNPEPLQQRIQQEQQNKPGLPPDLQKLLALNIVTNEKDAMAQQQAMSQLAQMQGPQGQPPTVFESVQEQARQKMEAQQVQAQQQQQAMQAMMQQAGPGPVPPDTPQPQRQPQGIDELPVEFQMAGGGIIAFEKGGKGEYETPYDRMNRENREKEDRKKEESDKPLDAQAAADRAAIVSLLETLRGGSESAGRAIADIATMVPRSLASAYDTVAVRPMRAAGIDAAYLAPKLTPEGASTGSPTPFSDVQLAREAKKTEPQVSRTLAQNRGALNAAEARMQSAPPAPTPVADLRALAEQQRRQQAPRPAPATVAAPAPIAAAPEAALVPESQAAKLLSSRLNVDPMAERVAEQELRRKEIGEPDTSTHDRMIAELEKRKAQLEGPQDSFGQLMEYLGQIAATPRGMSSFEAGAAGAANLRKAEKARQLEQFDLSKQALEVSQKKIDTVRTFATEQYNVGKTRFDQVYKEQFEAAKEITKDEGEARKLAQENTLKRLEIEQRDREASERNKTQITTANIGAEGRRMDERRNQQYLNLTERARQLRDAGKTAEADRVLAQANDILSLKGGSGTAGVGAGRNKIMERRQTMTELQQIIKDEGMVYSDAQKAEAAREYQRLALMNVKEGDGGGGGSFTVTAGGKTYTFPTQEAANKFKAEAGVK